MGILSNTLNIFGVLLLSHAVYSAHEHSLLATNPTSLTTAPTAASSSTTGVLSLLKPNLDLPLDITLETLFSVLIICIGIVLSSPDLKPIQWRVWAGRIEREKQVVRTEEMGPRGNPYLALERRQGFLDIRAARKEFADWVKAGAGSDTVQPEL